VRGLSVSEGIVSAAERSKESAHAYAETMKSIRYSYTPESYHQNCSCFEDIFYALAFDLSIAFSNGTSAPTTAAGARHPLDLGD
jgi:hypothetical protein